MGAISDDIRDLLLLLNRHGVEYAICGGHAVAFHGYSRLTMDVDVLIKPSPENARRLAAALGEFGFGHAGIPFGAFAVEGTAVSLGVQPNQIDLLTSMSSQSTREVFAHLVEGHLAGVPVRIVSADDLLRAKHEAGRPKDLVDAAELAQAAARRAREDKPSD